MAETAAGEKTRLNLELTNQARDQIQRLRARTNSSSVTEVIRRSLALYDLFTEHSQEGGEVIFQHPDGTKERLRIL